LQTQFQELNVAEIALEGTICSSPEGCGKRVQAKANCLASIVKWKNNRINYLPLSMQGFGKPVLTAVLLSKLKC